MPLPAAGILCVHLAAQDGLTFYLVCTLPPIGLCGICYTRFGRVVEAVPEKNLTALPLALFERRKDKSYPVYNRIIERRGLESA